MPNHVQNKLEILATPAEVAEIKSFLSTDEDTTIDFNVIGASPEEIADGAVVFGVDWGTSDAYGMPDARDTDNTIYFVTAWDDVAELIGVLSSQFPNVEFLYKWADEDTGMNVGECRIQNGHIAGSDIEERSREAYELAFELWPEDRERYAFSNGNYENIS